VNNGKELPSILIKEKFRTNDWKIVEQHAKGIDYLEYDVTEYSDEFGIGFADDKHDKEKAIRMIYWGFKPKNIPTTL
jgi:hypothetical protein